MEQPSSNKSATAVLVWSALIASVLGFVLTAGVTAQTEGQNPPPKSRSESLAHHFPNVLLLTQENKAVRFYDDLVKGKVVLISFMYTSCRSICPVTTANLAKVQEELGDRLGRDIFMLSISLDPDTDTPDVLKRFAEAFHAKPGWYFLTGQKRDIDLIRRKLGAYERDAGPDAEKAQHTAIVTFGNEATGRWSAIIGVAQSNRIVRAVLRLAGASKG